ncbi:translation initiation factor IF-2 [Anseongella ginsenosidimutans]|nr:translation initiation factor IF-2 [Anseongella ginsenosidimutans]
MVGKIDLDALGKKPKPVQKEAEEAPKPEKAEAAPKQEEAKAEQAPVKEEKAPEQEKEQPAATAESAEKTPAETPAETAKEAAPAESTEKTAPESAEEAPAESAEKTSPETTEEAAPAEQPAAEAATPAPADAEPGKEDPNKREVIRATARRLTGPKVIGRIELPAERKSKPVASSSGQPEKGKRKRKRREKGTVAPVSTGQQHPSKDNKPGKTGAKDHHRKGKEREEVDEKQVQEQIKATLARLSGAGKSGKFAQRARLRRQKRDDIARVAEEEQQERELQSKVLRVTEFLTANELASMMDVSVTQIIATCMSLGLFVSINQRLDAETISIVAGEFGFDVNFITSDDQDDLLEEEDAEEDLVGRHPIVTVMGHVDHGKTSLLDYVRKANVIAGEAGSITQHIGAYEVGLDDGRKITFLDTPGHEAFTAMRARGAKVTDVVIIVIAADDSVMPQTIEAINHAQAAGVPMVFAFNKMDKQGASADKIREQLANMNILVEEWGGKFQTQEISAKSGMGVDDLLDKVLLEAELLDLKANPEKKALGTVIEAAMEKGRGVVTTVLIQAGTLRVGEPILAGQFSGRVKALFNERGKKIEKAGPATPVQVLGMQGAPQAGDRFNAVETEQEAKDIATRRQQLQREQGLRTQKHITLDEIGRRLAIGNFKELNLIVKGDVDGSVEALSDSLLKLSTEEIQINVIHKSVGQISESDVLLASASDAIILGFQVRPSPQARRLAEQEEIDIRLYSVIYKAIEEIKAAMEGLLTPDVEEKIVCNLEVRDTFKVTKVGTVAGCMVLDGKITRNTNVRLIRDGVVVYTGELASLKRFKEDVKEVTAGYECGLNIQNFNDIKTGDIIEGYEEVQIKRKL